MLQTHALANRCIFPLSPADQLPKLALWIGAIRPAYGLSQNYVRTPKGTHMTETASPPDISRVVKKWRNKRGSLIMALHEIQNRYGYVPREVSLQLAQLMDVPMARIYEVLTFYNYFKMEAPGKYIVSICMGTACYLKGAPGLIEAFKTELDMTADEGTTEDGLFHLQAVRCVGCCGLAPAVVINGVTYSKVKPEDVPTIIAKLRKEG